MKPLTYKFGEVSAGAIKRCGDDFKVCRYRNGELENIAVLDNPREAAVLFTDNMCADAMEYIMEQVRDEYNIYTGVKLKDDNSEEAAGDNG